MNTIKLMDEDIFSFTFENASPFSKLPLSEGQRLVCVTRDPEVYDRLKRVELKVKLGYTFDSALHWAQTGNDQLLMDDPDCFSFIFDDEEEEEVEESTEEFWSEDFQGTGVHMVISDQEELDMTLRHIFAQDKIAEGYTLTSVYEWALNGDDSILAKE